MRLLRIVRQFSPRPLSLCVLFVLWTGFIVAPTAAQQNDALEELRTVLKRPVDEDPLVLKHREDDLEKAAKRLESINELRLALSLIEWKDANLLTSELRTAEVDRKVRTAIGTRLERIVREVAANGDNTSRVGVADFVGEIGSSIRALNPNDHRGFARGLSPSLLELAKSDDPAVRQAAVRALAKVNPEPAAAAAAAEPLLKSKILADRLAASKALAELIGNPLSLQKKGGAQPASATRADVYACAQEVVPVCGASLADPDLNVRRNCLEAMVLAAAALGELPEAHTDDQISLPPSGTKWTKDQEERVNIYRATLAAEAKDFAPLVQALNLQGQNLANNVDDPDANLRRLSRRTLELLAIARARLMLREASIPTQAIDDPPKKPADPLHDAIQPGLKVIARGTTDADLSVRRATLDFLESLEDAAQSAVPTLIAALADQDKFIRWAAARTLGKIGPLKGDPVQTERMVAGIARLLHPNEDPAVREIAAGSLRRFGAAAKPSLPALIAMLNVGEADAQEEVIKAITGIGGPETHSAIPALVKSLDARSPGVRKLAAEALGRMGPMAAGALPALREHRQDDDAAVRTAVSEAIVSITRPR